MIVLQQTVLVLNLALILVFGLDCAVIDNQKVAPKTKAKIGVWLVGLFFVFLILLSLYAVCGAVLGRNALYLGLLAYAAVPFAIGHLVSSRTLKFYTIAQILFLLLSAGTLIAL